MKSYDVIVIGGGRPSCEAAAHVQVRTNLGMPPRHAGLVRL